MNHAALASKVLFGLRVTAVQCDDFVSDAGHTKVKQLKVGKKDQYIAVLYLTNDKWPFSLNHIQ